MSTQQSRWRERLALIPLRWESCPHIGGKHHGETAYYALWGEGSVIPWAYVKPLLGREGWFWFTQDLPYHGIAHVNTKHTPNDTREEAQHAAAAYVREGLRSCA